MFNKPQTSIATSYFWEIMEKIILAKSSNFLLKTN